MSKLLKEMKDILDRVPGRLDMFWRTCFGPWIDFTAHHKDLYLLHLFLQTIDRSEPLVDAIRFRVGGYVLDFGPRDYCLITGLRFGHCDPLVAGTSSFRARVFPAISTDVSLTDHDLYRCLRGADFDGLSDDDAVRVCLLLMHSLFFRGYGKEHKIDDKYVILADDLGAWDRYPWGLQLWIELVPQLWDALPSRIEAHKEKIKNGIVPKWTFTGGFIYSLKIWICETFPYASKHMRKDPRVISRGLAWSRLLGFVWHSIMELLRVDIHARRPVLRMQPTQAELAAEWWISSCAYLDDPSATV